MNRLTCARGLASLAACFAILLIVVGAAITPNYSHTSQFISELGARGAAFGELVSWGGFLPVGILLALFLVVAAPVVPFMGAARIGFYLFVASQSVAYISAAFAPCDLGCPVEGSVAQGVHNLSGLLTYLTAGAALFMMATTQLLRPAMRAAFVFAGIAWLTAFFLMAEPSFASWRGLSQRVAESILWISLLYIAWQAPAEAASKPGAQ